MNIRDWRASTCASLALWALATGAVSAASFDCAKARSQVEHLVCDTPALSQLDDALASAYSAALSGDPSARQRQMAWLRDVRNRCEDERCLTSAYQAQIQAMAPVASAGGAAPMSLTPTSDPGSPQWTCPINWSALADIDGPDPERVILGIKAREWRKEHLEMMLLRQQECQRSSGAPESLRQAESNDVRTRAYPNALAAIERRDQRLQQAALRAKQAEPSSTPLASPPSQGTTPAPVQQAAVQQSSAEPARQSVTHEAGADGTYQAKQSRETRLMIAGAVLLALVAAWVWHKFIRNRCPKCRSTNIETTDVSETDRWRGTKQVTEKHSRGSRTRHVSATYVKNAYSYRCRDCQTEWTVQRKEEL